MFTKHSSVNCHGKEVAAWGNRSGEKDGFPARGVTDSGHPAGWQFPRAAEDGAELVFELHGDRFRKMPPRIRAIMNISSLAHHTHLRVKQHDSCLAPVIDQQK